MTQQGSRENSAPRAYRPLRVDRRCRQRLQPPPYLTADGPIEADRRSYLDRRSAWIRDYVINGDGDDSH